MTLSYSYMNPKAGAGVSLQGGMQRHVIELKDVEVAPQDGTACSLCVATGEMVCVAASDAAWRTSLLKAVLGLHPVAGGWITFNAEPLTPRTVALFRPCMAYVPMDIRMPSMPVPAMMQLLFALKTNDDRRYSRTALFAEWERMGLSPQLYECGGEEVGEGCLRRMLLAVAGLMHKPVIVVDDPTGGMDVAEARMVADYLRLVARRGSAVLVGSGDAAVQAVSDRVVRC
ncbi:MAG: hypothetical protein ACI350_04625 [Prevotella sp.]